jgi:hypothetical protein
LVSHRSRYEIRCAILKNKYIQINIFVILLGVVFLYFWAFIQGRKISFWPPYIENKTDKIFINPPSSRKDAINGIWEGIATQIDEKLGKKSYPSEGNF